jgi:hypothetical protein
VKLAGRTTHFTVKQLDRVSQEVIETIFQAKSLAELTFGAKKLFMTDDVG